MLVAHGQTILPRQRVDWFVSDFALVNTPSPAFQRSELEDLPPPHLACPGRWEQDPQAAAPWPRTPNSGMSSVPTAKGTQNQGLGGERLVT